MNIFTVEDKKVGKLNIEWSSESSEEDRIKFIENCLGSFKKLSNTPERSFEIKENSEVDICYGYLDDGRFIVGPMIIRCKSDGKSIQKVVKKILELSSEFYKESEETNLESESKSVTNSLFSKGYCVYNYIDKYYCEVFTINYGCVYGRSKGIAKFLVEFRDSSIYLDPILNKDE